MLIARTRRDVEAAIREGEQTGSHPVHVTNAAGTHTVAIRGYARAVHFGQRLGETEVDIQVKWYNRLGHLDSAQAVEVLDDITDWLLEPEVAANDCAPRFGTRTLFGRQFAVRPTHRR